MKVNKKKKIFYCPVFLIVIICAVFLSFYLRVNNNILISNGAWCWFQSPQAVSYKGLFDKTYIGYVNNYGDISISSYDNKSRKVESTILHYNLEIDDHAAPSILVKNDGKIIVFYSKHTGESLYYRISVKAEDISLWGEEQKINTNKSSFWGNTYSNPIQLSGEDNKMYLFWRGEEGYPVFTISTDDGVSWKETKTLLEVSGERPYLKVSSNNIDKIYFTFTDGHPNEVNANNIYFVYYRNNSFYKADGTFVKKIEDLPLTVKDLDIVYDSNQSGVKSWNWDISYDKEENPVIVYSTFKDINNHYYNYARWSENKWLKGEITQAGGFIGDEREKYYSGGISVDGKNPNIVYLSKKVNNIYEIQQWITKDIGLTWNFNKTISDSKNKNIRPVVPLNNDKIKVLWMSGEYNHYTDYDTMIEANIK